MRRPFFAVAIVTVAVVIASAAGAVTARRPASALTRCAASWNHATLGEGRRFASAEAAAVPHGRSATLVRFSDGVCGLVFSAQQSAATGMPQVLVRVMHGDYPWGSNPRDVSGLALSNQSDVARRAAHAHNVTVSLPTGQVVPHPRGHVLVLPFPAVSTQGAGQPCPRIFDPRGGPYAVIKRAPSCATTRELVWADTDHEGKVTTAGTQTITGWRCTGSTPPGSSTNGSGAPAQIDCTRAGRTLEVRALIPILASP